MKEGSIAPGLAHILGLEDTSLLRNPRTGPKVSTPTPKSRTIRSLIALKSQTAFSPKYFIYLNFY